MAIEITGTFGPTGTNAGAPAGFATHEANFGLGGYMQVADNAARDAISNIRRAEGMAVYVNDTDKLYILKDGVTNNDWVEFSSGGGGGAVNSVSNTFGSFLSGTNNTTATGAVDLGTINLNATGTPDATSYLRGDNTWSVPPNDDTTYTFVSNGTPDPNLRLSDGSTNQDVQLVGSGGTTITNANNVITISSSAGSNPTMQDVYDASAVGKVEAADYTKELELVNNEFSFITNNQTNSPVQGTVPRTEIRAQTTASFKEVIISSVTQLDDDDATGKGRIFMTASNTGGTDEFLSTKGRIYMQTYGQDTAPLTPVNLDPVTVRTSGSGVAITASGGEENPGTVRLYAQNQGIPGSAPTNYNDGWVEVVSPYQPAQQGELNSIFSIGTQRLYLNESCKWTNGIYGPADGDILQIRTAKDANGGIVNRVELQSITPQKYNQTVERDKSPTCWIDTQAATITLNITGVKNGQYGTIYLKHPPAFAITLGNINGAAANHQVVNGQAGVLPATESVVEEPVVDVYTYLWIQKDDTDPAGSDTCVWNYGLNYT